MVHPWFQLPAALYSSPRSSLHSTAGREWPCLASVHLPGNNNLVVMWGFPALFSAEIIQVWIIWLQSWFCFVFNADMRTMLSCFFLPWAVVQSGPAVSRMVLRDLGGWSSLLNLTLVSNLLFSRRPHSIYSFFLLSVWCMRWNVVWTCGTVHHSCGWSQRCIHGTGHGLLRASATPTKTLSRWILLKDSPLHLPNYVPMCWVTSMLSVQQACLEFSPHSWQVY